MKFEEFSKRIKKFSKDTMNEVQRMNEVRQFNARIHEEKKLLNSVYAEIGKKLYHQYKEAPLAGFEEDFHKVEERFSAIEIYADQVRKIRGVRLCPNCNTEVSAAEKFCSNCGSRLPEVDSIEESSQEVEGLSQNVETAAEEETVVDAEEKDIRREEEPAGEAEKEAESAEETVEAEKEAEAEKETEPAEEDAQEEPQKETEEEAIAREADAAAAAADLQEGMNEAAQEENTEASK